MPVFGYWEVRGLAQPIRLLLNYVEEQYDEKFYNWGPPPDFKCDQWFVKDKPALGMDVPNLPYYIDGQRKISQSTAILRYLARKYKLDGQTEDERVRNDVVFYEANDFRQSTFQLFYSPKFDTDKVEYLKKLPPNLEKFEKFLGSSPWFGGANISFVDFVLYEVLDVERIFQKDCLDNFPNLLKFMTRFEDLPTLKKYLTSDMAKSRRIVGPWGFWGV